MQEEGNISIATKTTSQCHVTMVAKLAPYRRQPRAHAAELPAPPRRFLPGVEFVSIKFTLDPD